MYGETPKGWRAIHDGNRANLASVLSRTAMLRPQQRMHALNLAVSATVVKRNEAIMEEPRSLETPAGTNSNGSGADAMRAPDDTSSEEPSTPTTVHASEVAAAVASPVPGEPPAGGEGKHPRKRTGTDKRPSQEKKKPAKPADSQDKDRPSVPRSERLGTMFHMDLAKYVKDHNGQYIRLEDNSLHLVLDGRRIPLRFDRTNPELARFFLSAIRLTDLSSGAQAALRRLEVDALDKAGRIRLRKFSSLSADGERLYIPISDGQLLQISAAGVSQVRNGDNADHLWLEHPENSPLQYKPGDPSDGLALFEKLIVETQACQSAAMRWFVAMAAGLFPFIRDSCPARLILVLIGPSQSGKTSGAQRFTLLHGLGEVKGDFSVAALSSLGDVGLLVLDNKEQANFSQPLIDFCLFLSTGAERGRSQVDGRLRTGSAGRPAAIVTTIEGLVKKELRARTVEIQYGVAAERTPRGPIERQILERRDEIGSALVRVLERYLQLRAEPARLLPNPTPEFQEHFDALCYLLMAFGDVAGKPREWSEGLIQQWHEVLTHAANNDEEEDLEHPIVRLLAEHDKVCDDFTDEQFEFQNKSGRLYITTASDLLTMLQKLKLPNLTLPQNPQGLSRRLADANFRAFTFFKTDSEGMPQLKRKSGRKPIGFFRPYDDDDA